MSELKRLESDSNIFSLVCDIQRFSIHDGPGIRTTVFFKGCPLRCIWCQNPETLKFENELVFSEEKCIACGDCEKACKNKAITFNKGPIINWELCKACFSCTEVCPSRALEPCAKEFSPESLCVELLKDREFYFQEGGVTLSGGEPFSRPEFILELLPILKREKINVAVETCGHFNFERLREAFEMIDLVLFDLKAITPTLHRTLTGKGNELIIKNLKNIIELKIHHQIRMPIVPHMNDSNEELKNVAKFLLELGEREIWLIPYHRLGESKLKKLNTHQKPLGLNSLSDRELRERAMVLSREGLRVRSFNFEV